MEFEGRKYWHFLILGTIHADLKKRSNYVISKVPQLMPEEIFLKIGMNGI